MAIQIDLGKVVPEKGVDYFTNADKNQIKNEIQNSISSELATKELKANLTTILDENSTNSQYPCAKVVYTKTKSQDEKLVELINQIPSKKVTGENINVTDSSNLPIKSFSLSGNSGGTITGDNTLKLYGANLFDANAIIGKYPNGVMFEGTPERLRVSIASQGQIIRKISCVLPKGTYNFKATVNSSKGSYGMIRIFHSDNSTTTLLSIGDTQVIQEEVNKTITSTTGIQSIEFRGKANTYYEMINFIISINDIEYTPYIEPQTQLLSLGDTQLESTDKISLVDNAWCINTTPIADTNLINQLNNILSFQTYKTITNFIIEPSNIAPIIEIEYRQDIETILNNYQTRLSQLAENL